MIGRRSITAVLKGTAAAIAVAVFLAMPADETKSAATPKTHLIEIYGLKFTDPKEPVHTGDMIVWINKDIVPHTASDTAGKWDSGDISPDASWRMTVQTAGVLDYLCLYHPSMRAKIVVSE